jgi:hypothetical protein
MLRDKASAGAGLALGAGVPHIIRATTQGRNIRMSHNECRHYVTYSGVKLPLKLVNPLQASDIANRNTYFRAWFDERGRMVACEKVVYGEVELRHRYEYHDNGSLKQAEITEADEETRVMRFDETA